MHANRCGLRYIGNHGEAKQGCHGISELNIVGGVEIVGEVKIVSVIVDVKGRKWNAIVVKHAHQRQQIEGGKTVLPNMLKGNETCGEYGVGYVKIAQQIRRARV